MKLIAIEEHFLTGEVGRAWKNIFDKQRDGDNNQRLQELHELPFVIYGRFYDKFGIQWIFKGDKGE